MPKRNTLFHAQVGRAEAGSIRIAIQRLWEGAWPSRSLVKDSRGQLGLRGALGTMICSVLSAPVAPPFSPEPSVFMPNLVDGRGPSASHR